MRSKAVVVRLEDLLGEPESEWSRELAFVQRAAPMPLLTLVPAETAIPAALSKLRPTLKRAWSIVSLLLVIAMCVFWALFLRPQSLGGPAGYVLVSGKSMNPLYHTGDMILVEHHSGYRVGDIIAYHVPKSDPMAGAQVIHRIIGGNGTHGFVVQGDNRTAPDVWRPKNSDIVGSATLKIPQAVVLLQFLRSPLLLGLLAASFAFVYLLTGGKKEQDAEPAPPLA